MPICSFCGKEIVFSNGCDAKYIRIGPKVYERISFKGRKDDFEDNDGTSADVEKDASNRCMCCGAYPGKYHHPYCPMEVCPRCHQVLDSCRCRRKMICVNSRVWVSMKSDFSWKIQRM